jgi:23S rRNA maturation mini-RNase III
VDYKWATALEALIGWLVLTGNPGRAEELTLQAIAAIDAKKT